MDMVRIDTGKAMELENTMDRVMMFIIIYTIVVIKYCIYHNVIFF